MHKIAGLLLLVLTLPSYATPLEFTNALDGKKITYMYSFTKNEVYIDPATPIDDNTVCTLAAKSQLQSLKIIKDFNNPFKTIVCK